MKPYEKAIAQRTLFKEYLKALMAERKETFRKFAASLNSGLPEDACITHATVHAWSQGKYIPGRNYFALIMAYYEDGSWQRDFGRRGLEILYPGGALF